MLTVSEIANHATVSKGTELLVMNNKPGISDKMRMHMELANYHLVAAEKSCGAVAKPPENISKLSRKGIEPDGGMTTAASTVVHTDGTDGSVDGETAVCPPNPVRYQRRIYEIKMHPFPAFPA